jgi:hypothetical protein
VGHIYVAESNIPPPLPVYMACSMEAAPPFAVLLNKLYQKEKRKRHLIPWFLLMIDASLPQRKRPHSHQLVVYGRYIYIYIYIYTS